RRSPDLRACITGASRTGIGRSTGAVIRWAARAVVARASRAVVRISARTVVLTTTRTGVAGSAWPTVSRAAWAVVGGTAWARITRASGARIALAVADIVWSGLPILRSSGTNGAEHQQNEKELYRFHCDPPFAPNAGLKPRREAASA